MRIRTYLAISYLSLVILITLGAMILGKRNIENLAADNLAVAETAVRGLADANYEMSETILTSYGEKMVEMQAESTAKELSYILGGRDSYDYDKLRTDAELRKIGTQDILTAEGVAGYLTIGDRTGVSVLHPNRSVEGKNFSEWAEEFPDLWKYVQRSSTESKVKGYYTFVDTDNNVRKKYIVMVHIPRTPFTVAAVVNIDQYFLPVHERIRMAQTNVMANAAKAIADSSRAVLSSVKLVSSAGGAVLLVMGALIGWWIATLISRPIMRLRDGVNQIGRGDFTAEVAEEGAAELRELAQSFNRLGKQLTEYVEKRDFIRDTFGRYLTMEVVNRLLESKDGLQLGGESREISMIMSDLRGFTALTASMNPQQVITFLNRYLGKMVEILLDYCGIIDEIIGDGILAFFGAPEPMEDHPARAVACALSMQAAMEEINRRNEADGLPHLEMGVAVNTGTVVVGNIGSEKRTKYGAVGAEINFTGRVESFTVGGQVLVSRSTFDSLKGILQVRNVLQVEMKGVPGKVPLYDVRGIGGDFNLHLTDHDEAPVRLEKPLNAQIHRLDQKEVTGSETMGRITHISMKSAVIVLKSAIGQWEDLRIFLLDEDLKPKRGEIYGKVLSVSEEDDSFATVVRFTSVSPEAYTTFRQATYSGSL
jgi:class 3 adenylate cyclase/HAMP domain-containing protein